MVSLEEQASRESPGVWNAYLGCHTGGWDVTAGPRRCRGQRARASHWSTVWTSPLTYRNTYGNKALLPPNAPLLGPPCFLPSCVQGSTDAGASKHRDLRHQANKTEWVTLPIQVHAKKQRLLTTRDAKLKHQAFRSLLPWILPVQPMPSFSFFNTDRSYFYKKCRCSDTAFSSDTSILWV